MAWKRREADQVEHAVYFADLVYGDVVEARGSDAVYAVDYVGPNFITLRDMPTGEKFQAPKHHRFFTVVGKEV